MFCTAKFKIILRMCFHTLRRNSPFPSPNTRRLTHSFRSLSYDWPTASSKASSPHSVIQCFLFQLVASFLSLNFTQQQLMFSSSSSHHLYPSVYLSFNKAFQKAVPTQHVTDQITLPSFYCFQNILLFFGSVTRLCFSHDPFKRSFPRRV